MRSIWKVLGFFVLLSVVSGKKQEEAVEDVTDLKEFKKLLRARMNLLVVFHNGGLSRDTSTLISSVAKASKGKGTLVKVDCGDAGGRKLCKKLKVDGGGGGDLKRRPVLKHFKDGEFHKNYDRPITETSLTSFILDPTGEPLWEEDPDASDVLFLSNQASFDKALKRDKSGMLVMFYAPWCGHCKRMKPEFQKAATEVKGKGAMAAVNVDGSGNAPLKRRFNITGFPTLLYFEKGEMKFDFRGRSSSDFVDFMSASLPRSPPKAAEPEPQTSWADEPSEVVHLTDETFDAALEGGKSTLVMFYAPWCGHCKRIKPEFVAAAAELKAKGSDGVLAAVDATKERRTASRFEIKGFPTLKYFSEGEEMFDAGDVRTKDALVSFMLDPKEPPPPPPPVKPWAEEAPEVEHLNDDTFRTFLKKKKHVLVMFYAPWCGHCKAAKPEVAGAAEEMAENPRVKFAGVDCTENQQLCAKHGVRGYPTFKYFSYFDKAAKDYDGGRKKDDFVAFMKDPEGWKAPPEPKEGEDSWAEAEYVVHLHDDDFEEKLGKAEHALVAFYAPWCGHCKRMKPEYAKAAKMVETSKDFEGMSLLFAALDATVEKKAASKFDLKGYPTITYHRYGAKAEDYVGGRNAKDFLGFLANKARAAEKTEL